MDIQPKAFATELISMIAAKMGQRYWIINLDTRSIPLLDHKVEYFLPAVGLSILRDFFLHFLQTDYFGDIQADRDSGNRHHNRVGQKIEKVKELHADDGNSGQRPIAKAGEGS